MVSDTGICLDGVTVDFALRKIGGYKRWHLATLTLLGCTSFSILVFHTLAILFIGWTPDFHCAGPDNISVVWDQTSEGLRPSKCHMYSNFSIDNTTTTCITGWEYEDQSYYTISSQWDLVCSNAVLIDTNQAIYKGGAATGEIIGAYVMDRFGRKLTHLFGLLGIAVFGTSAIWAPNFIMFSIFRFIVGVCIAKRDVAAIGSQAFWVMGYMLAGLAGYLCPNWKIYQIIASSIALLGFAYIWLLLESPLWIAAKGKFEEAERVLEQIARWNNVNVTRIRLNRTTVEPERSVLMAKQAITSSPTEIKIVDLFKDGVLLKHGCVALLLWFSNFLVYFFIVLSAPSFAGGRFLNYFLGGLVEVPAYFIAYLVCKRFGRRLPECVFHIIAAVALGSLTVIHFVRLSEAAEVPLIMTFSLLGKMAITCTFAITVPYTKELVPTAIRGMSGGLIVILGQMGAMSAPLLAFVMKTPMKWIPLTVCAILCLASGLLTLLLPDTFNKPLPQTLQDVHDLYKPTRITNEADIKSQEMLRLTTA